MCVYLQGGPVEILSFLYLGSAHHSSQRELLRRCGITAVLNVSLSCPNLFEHELSYMSLKVEDSMAADIRVLFPQAIHFIGKLQFSDFTSCLFSRPLGFLFYMFIECGMEQFRASLILNIDPVFGLGQ